jgi:hypothetical protein
MSNTSFKLQSFGTQSAFDPKDKTEHTSGEDIIRIESQIVQLQESVAENDAEIADINDEISQIQEQIQAGSLRNIIILENIGASTLTGPNNSVFYSLNQNPGQLVIDPEIPVGSEYIVYAGSNNTVSIQTLDTDVVIQISGDSLNDGTNNVLLGFNSKVTLTKITANLWIAQGDTLSYEPVGP